jgi:hypothetical protein
MCRRNESLAVNSVTSAQASSRVGIEDMSCAYLPRLRPREERRVPARFEVAGAGADDAGAVVAGSALVLGVPSGITGSMFRLLKSTIPDCGPLRFARLAGAAIFGAEGSTMGSVALSRSDVGASR